MTYEEWLIEAEKNNICVDENYNFKNNNYKGLYIDGNIALSNKLQNSNQRACIMAEELGHHFTTYGNIININDAKNLKLEKKARSWAYDNQIGLLGIVNAFEKGLKSISEISDYLNVTEEFFHEAIKYMTGKYGVYARLDNYIIYFIPSLAVLKMNQ